MRGGGRKDLVQGRNHGTRRLMSPQAGHLHPPSLPEAIGSKRPRAQWLDTFFSDEELVRTGVISPWIRAWLSVWSSLLCPG